MKYRIVKRNRNFLGELSTCPWYYAQRNILGVWIDIRHNPYITAYDSYDDDLVIVEKWLENHIQGKKSPTQEVVKTYD